VVIAMSIKAEWVRMRYRTLAGYVGYSSNGAIVFSNFSVEGMGQTVER